MVLTIWRGIFIQLIIANPKDPPIIHLLPFPPSVAQPGQPLQQLVAVRDRCLADPEIQQAVGEQRQHQQQQTEQPQQLTGGESLPLRAKMQCIGPLGASGHAALATGALETLHRDELVHLDARGANPAALVAVVARTSQAAGRVAANAQWGQQAEQGEPGAIGAEVAAEPLPEGGGEQQHPAKAQARDQGQVEEEGPHLHVRRLMVGAGKVAGQGGGGYRQQYDEEQKG